MALDLADKSGNGQTLSLNNGGPTDSTTNLLFGDPNNTHQGAFAGGSQYLSFGSTSNLPTGNFTLECWMKGTATTAGQLIYISDSDLLGILGS